MCVTHVFLYVCICIHVYIQINFIHTYMLQLYTCICTCTYMYVYDGEFSINSTVCVVKMCRMENFVIIMNFGLIMVCVPVPN